MRLQRMRYDFWDETAEVICAVNNVSMGGEFTICGNAIPDGAEFGATAIGPEFDGKLKDVTCPNCKKIIDFIKSLK